MRFHGLPDRMDVGAADLTPVTPCALLTACRCSCCACVSPRFFLCERDHVLCGQCCIRRQNQAEEDNQNRNDDNAGADVWCPKCQRMVKAIESGCPMRLLASTNFRCNCGTEGTLEEIRAHLLNGDHIECEPNANNDVAQAEQDLDERMRNIAREESRVIQEESQVALQGVRQELEGVLDGIRDDLDGEARLRADREVAIQELKDEVETLASEESVNQLRARIGAMDVAFAQTKLRLDPTFANLNQYVPRQRLETQLQEQKAEIVSSTNAIARQLQAQIRHMEERLLPPLEAKIAQQRNQSEEIMARVGNIEIVTNTVKMISGAISSSTVGTFLFQFGDVYSQFKQGVNGDPVKSDYQIRLVGGVPLKVQIECSSVQGTEYFGVFVGGTNQLPSSCSWPIKRTIVVQVLNNSGITANSLSFRTQKNECEYHASFSDPSVETSTGWAQFMTVDELRTGDCLSVENSVCVVVQVQPFGTK